MADIHSKQQYAKDYDYDGLFVKHKTVKFKGSGMQNKISAVCFWDWGKKFENIILDINSKHYYIQVTYSCVCVFPAANLVFIYKKNSWI